MLINNYTFSDVEQFFSNFATGFVGKHTIVRISEENALSYTLIQDEAKQLLIFLCKNHPLMNALPENLSTMFRFGILSHEILHRIFTDYEAYRKFIKKKYSEEFITVH